MGQQVIFALHQSMHRVLVLLVSLLPGVLVLFVSIVMFTALGFAIAYVLRKILVAIRFDEKLAARETAGSPSSFSDWSPSHSPSLFLQRGVLWLSILAGVAIGISALDASDGNGTHLSVFLLPYLTHTLGALLLLFFGGLLARFLSRSVLISAVNAQLQYARFLSLGVKWLVLVLTAAMALDHLQIGGVIIELAFGILFGGIVLTLAISIGHGSRDIVSRSIEKNMERPSSKPSEPHSSQDGPSNLRHF
jgi:hypothetical protein